MPYLQRRTGVRPLPKGMGAANANCEWWDVLCYYGVTKPAYAQPLPAPPSGSAPASPQTVQQMTVPGAYTPTQSATDSADIYQQNVDSFFNSLDTSNANNFAGACDPSQQAWLSPSSWCSGRLIGVLAFSLAGVVAVTVMRGAHR